MIDRRGARPRVRARRERHGRCPACGAKVVRKKTFTKMLEPGQDIEELRTLVQAIADSWRPSFRHTSEERCLPPRKF